MRTPAVVAAALALVVVVLASAMLPADAVGQAGRAWSTTEWVVTCTPQYADFAGPEFFTGISAPAARAR